MEDGLGPESALWPGVEVHLRAKGDVDLRQGAVPSRERAHVPAGQ